MVKINNETFKEVQSRLAEKMTYIHFDPKEDLTSEEDGCSYWIPEAQKVYDAYYDDVEVTLEECGLVCDYGIDEENGKQI